MFITTCRITWHEWEFVPFCGTDDPTWLMNYNQVISCSNHTISFWIRELTRFCSAAASTSQSSVAALEQFCVGFSRTIIMFSKMYTLDSVVGSFFGIPWPFSWKLSFLVVLGTLDSDIKNELLCPSRFWGESPEKQRFQKWLSPVPAEQKIFICGAILTNKRSILTNSAMEISFLTFFFTIKHILEHEFKMAAAKNEILCISTCAIWKSK